MSQKLTLAKLINFIKINESDKMFIQNKDGHYRCDCGDDTFTLTYKNKSYKIFGIVDLLFWNNCWHTIRRNTFLITMERKKRRYKFATNDRDFIDQLAIRFNSQIAQQIETLYSPDNKYYNVSKESFKDMLAPMY